MIIYKDKGLIYSEYILQQLIYFIDNENILGKVETFYNCRELGYLLRIHDKDYKKGLCIWIYAHRNSDEPTITYEEKMYPSESNNMFTEDAWLNNTFTYENVEKASEKAQEIINNYFSEEANK